MQRYAHTTNAHHVSVRPAHKLKRGTPHRAIPRNNIGPVALELCQKILKSTGFHTAIFFGHGGRDVAAFVGIVFVA